MFPLADLLVVPFLCNSFKGYLPLISTIYNYFPKIAISALVLHFLVCSKALPTHIKHSLSNQSHIKGIPYVFLLYNLAETFRITQSLTPVKFFRIYFC